MAKEQFLRKELPVILRQLDAEAEPAFGLLTPQHMIEHLTQVIKSSVKRYGEPENPPTDRQQGFQKFIAKGAVFKHRPSNKTAADLPALFYDSLDKAIEQIHIGIERFYRFYGENPEFKNYNPFMGELDFDQLELFHYQHVRYHMWQFGLLESYP